MINKHFYSFIIQRSTHAACGSVEAGMNQDTLGYIFSYLSLKDRYIVERVCQEWRTTSALSMHLKKSLTIDNTINIHYIHSIFTRNGIHCLKEINLLIKDDAMMPRFMYKDDKIVPCVSTLPQAACVSTLPQAACVSTLPQAACVYTKKYTAQYWSARSPNDILLLISLYCKNLKRFSLIDDRLFLSEPIWECSVDNIYNINLVHIFKNNKNLQRITLIAVVSHINLIMESISNCIDLEYIVIKLSLDINFIEFKFLLLCKKLKYIKVRYTNLNDEDFKIIATQCLSLEHITVTSDITDVGLCNMVKSISLKSIELYQCHITNAGLNYMFNNNNLVKIHIHRCYCITKNGLYNIDKCTALTELIIGSNWINNSIQNIAKCKTLERLTINSVNNDDNIKIILHSCKKLKYICIEHCSKYYKNFIKEECLKLNIKFDFGPIWHSERWG